MDKGCQLVGRVLRAAGGRLKQHGFNHSPSPNIFHRITSWGWHGVQLPYTVGHGGVVMRFTASVRFDAVERLVVRNSAPEYVDGLTRSTFAVFSEEACTIRAASGASTVVEWIEEMFEKYGDPLFARYASPHTAVGDLRALPAVNNRFDFPVDHERAKRVLAFLAVLGPSEDIHDAISEQHKWLVTQPGAIVAEFDSFVANLRRELAMQ